MASDDDESDAVDFEKDESIKGFLRRLAAEVGVESFRVADNWDGDRCAVGIESTREAGRLVYVCTYGKAPDRYFYTCDLPDANDEIGYRVIDEREGATFAEVVAAVRAHLELKA